MSTFLYMSLIYGLNLLEKNTMTTVTLIHCIQILNFVMIHLSKKTSANVEAENGRCNTTALATKCKAQQLSKYKALNRALIQQLKISHLLWALLSTYQSLPIAQASPRGTALRIEAKPASWRYGHNLSRLLPIYYMVLINGLWFHSFRCWWAFDRQWLD